MDEDGTETSRKRNASSSSSSRSSLAKLGQQVPDKQHPLLCLTIYNQLIVVVLLTTAVDAD